MTMYTVQFNAVSVSAQQDLIELLGPSDASIRLYRLLLSQSSEIGDAMEEGLNILLKSGQTTTGTGGTTPSAVPIELGGPAAGATCKVNNTGKAASGTIVTHYAWNWNVRVPFDYVWMPEERKVINPSTRLTVELATTPTDVIVMSGALVFEEIGG